jgi:hypothetical protein
VTDRFYCYTCHGSKRTNTGPCPTCCPPTPPPQIAAADDYAAIASGLKKIEDSKGYPPLPSRKPRPTFPTLKLHPGVEAATDALGVVRRPAADALLAPSCCPSCGAGTVFLTPVGATGTGCSRCGYAWGMTTVIPNTPPTAFKCPNCARASTIPHPTLPGRIACITCGWRGATPLTAPGVPTVPCPLCSGPSSPAYPQGVYRCNLCGALHALDPAPSVAAADDDTDEEEDDDDV